MKLRDKQIQNLFDSEITKRSLIATISYVGTGTYGQNNPTVINCGFKPKIIFFAINGSVASTGSNNGNTNCYGVCAVVWQEFITMLKAGIYPNYRQIYYTQTNTGLSFYATEFSSYQNNDKNIVYSYIALG